MVKNVVTITGIRPDFIRMSAIFRELDREFNHILIHTGQHYDKMLSDVFFDELHIRRPDYTLECGVSSTNQYEQLSYLSKAIPDLLKEKNLNPDMILFLGDSNTVAVAMPLKKEGYRIGHIEAGMRSYDKRMLEEINRTVCDVCSELLFVYHDDYKEQVAKENITDGVYVVGNTIVEVARPLVEKITTVPKRNDMILVDIHRPENSKYPHRIKLILDYCRKYGQHYKLPVKILYFKRTHDTVQNLLQDDPHTMDGLEFTPLMSYAQYLETVYHCKFIISDSGTGQEEPALFNTPVIVPRDFTERPQSIDSKCSYMLHIEEGESSYESSIEYLESIFSGKTEMSTLWLGDGQTAKRVVSILKEKL